MICGNAYSCCNCLTCMSLPSSFPLSFFLLLLGRSWLTGGTRRARNPNTIKLVVSGAQLCEFSSRGVLLLSPGDHQHPPPLLLQVYDSTFCLLPQVDFG